MKGCIYNGNATIAANNRCMAYCQSHNRYIHGAWSSICLRYVVPKQRVPSKKT